MRFLVDSEAGRSRTPEHEHARSKTMVSWLPPHSASNPIVGSTEESVGQKSRALAAIASLASLNALPHNVFKYSMTAFF